MRAASDEATLSFIHRFEPASGPGRPPLLLLHGTGGDENDLMGLGTAVAPGAARLSPRGQVVENGMPRFFRRLVEGVFDEADLRRRAAELARFVEEARATYGLAAPVALGFSNGANIAAALLLLHPEVLAGAALLRAMTPLVGIVEGKEIRLLAGEDDMLAVIRAGAEPAARPNGKPIALGSVTLDAPIPRPVRNVFCIGKNYHEHAKEFAGSGFDASSKEVVPEAPVVFTKPPSAVIGPGQPIPSYLDPTSSTDYEGEFTVVIGRGGRGITKAEALSHVFGYTIINDVTARTTQHRHRQWILGKASTASAQWVR